MFSTASLKFAYHTAPPFHFPDIRLVDGEHLLILGESGIGKTTMLHLMAGILKAQSGAIEVDGTNICTLSSQKLDRYRGQHIGLIFQRPHFIHALSLQENLSLIQHLGGVSKDSKRIKHVLDRLGIGHKLHQKPHQLSQGEQQRAAIAMAIVNQPSLILADEPTSSLDDKNCFKVAALLKEQATATGAHLIIITHDQRLKTLFQKSITL
ncbi:ABC-type lipoprotein export system ATPase subunit [Catalinimonas alkaloidigena]|uniref:ABC transporter ATP-binding protein n=1 Tax=Catalinimonas alkaloidigena TaxID=1075417 RepID=UPI002404DC24|nr:ATP-binding cassette domain-containing protein [Catalinimonas alkaloidigena]MDF9800834.1 ABC-type lipoprotein export system ATPase subunit [Catalinimonas alkaloidigena]